jgi:hypothetical protein
MLPLVAVRQPWGTRRLGDRYTWARAGGKSSRNHHHQLRFRFHWKPLQPKPTCAGTLLPVYALFAWLISHQPAVLFSHNKPATSNQPAVLFSQNKPAPAISHQPTEQAGRLGAVSGVSPAAGAVALPQVHTGALSTTTTVSCIV